LKYREDYNTLEQYCRSKKLRVQSEMEEEGPGDVYSSDSEDEVPARREPDQLNDDSESGMHYVNDNSIILIINLVISK
jgi:hypothetical protein